MSNIYIIEDSSIYDLGGGQRITLEVIKCLNASNENTLYLYDLGSGPTFSDKVGEHDLYSRFFAVMNVPHFFFKMPVIIYELVNKIENNKVFYLYSTTKKALLISVIIKLIKKNGVIVFHQHSSLGGVFDKLKFFVRTVITPGVITKEISKKTIEISNPIKLKSSKFACKVKSNNKIVIGFIGSLTTHKGFDIFIETYNLNNFPAIVAGTGALEKLLNLKMSLDYRGYIADQGKREFYKDIDILVFPSVVEETFSLVCFEAFFNYNPVVCFDVGYPSVIVKKYNVGVVADSRSAKSLNLAIEKCSNNLIEYSKNCRTIIDDFDNNEFCKKIKSIFN